MTSTPPIETPNPDLSDSLRDVFFRLGRVMERVDDLDEMLLTIIEECKRMLSSEAASIALYDPEEGDLVFTVASGGAAKGIAQWRMAMGQGIVGMVAESREALYSNDPKNDSRWYGAVDNSSGFITNNLAAVPMMRHGELIGVVEALNRPVEFAGGYNDEDLVLLQVFADQVALALEINRLIKAKQESERLATFAVALADIGHSTKNLLMRLEFPVKLIDRSIEKGDLKSLGEAWGVMKRATGDISSLVMEMLSYSKPRRPELAKVDIASVIRDVAEVCGPDAVSKNIELACIGSDAELIWPVDAKFFQTAMQNIVGNAIEAMAEHGGSRVAVTIEINEDPHELRVAVADDGPGIPPEIQRRIFDPFFSTKGNKGTGLGLASVKKGVEEHGGRVALVSEPGKGATFNLAFPWTEIREPRES